MDQHADAQALMAAGDYVKAVDCYNQILSASPADRVALQNVAVCLYQIRQFEAANLSLAKLVSAGHENAAIHYLQGLAFIALGNSAGAAEAIEKSLGFDPGNVAWLIELGCLYLTMGQAGCARDSFARALALDPQNLLVNYNLGVALQQLKDPVGAMALFETCIRLNPDFAEAHCNLALALVDQGELERGVAGYHRAIAIRPDFPEAYVNLSKPLVDLHRLAEAEQALKTALDLRPDYPVALENYASVLKLRGDFKGATQVGQQLAEIDPSNKKALIDQINLRRTLCDWDRYHEDIRYLRENLDVVEPFVFLNSRAGAAEQLVCARSWSTRFTQRERFQHKVRKTPRKLNIGYLSADFRRHATTYLVSELFERHNRDKFTLFGFSIGYDDRSEARRRVEQSFDRFVDLETTSFAQSAQIIFDNKIDILIDLKGYTGGSRTEILAARPAPIQVSYLGYPGTMGADFIDYIISDNIVSPELHQFFYSESIVQLPYSYQPNDTKRKISDVVYHRRDFGLPDDGFVFCSFNGAYKIDPEMFNVWMRILLQTPLSVLWLLNSSEATEGNLRREAAARGVDPDRLIFSTPMENAEHLARHGLADLFLDTSPINAHTTASDALWAGLPVLTVLGESFVGRVAASLLHAVGLPELVAQSMTDYEGIALSLAADPTRVKLLKEKLNSARLRAPLFDIQAYAQHLESAYLKMWDIHQSGASPHGFAVSP